MVPGLEKLTLTFRMLPSELHLHMHLCLKLTCKLNMHLHLHLVGLLSWVEGVFFAVRMNCLSCVVLWRPEALDRKVLIPPETWDLLFCCEPNDRQIDRRME